LHKKRSSGQKVAEYHAEYRSQAFLTAVEANEGFGGMAATVPHLQDARMIETS
jgi:hypothetical protein